jgi:hypothetical protein
MTMKRSVFFILLISLSVFSFAQQQGAIYDSSAAERPQRKSVPKFYIGAGVGINNISGMVGILAEVKVVKNFSLTGGLGIGPWGYKVSLQSRYYRNIPKGVFYGLGLSTASGSKDTQMQLMVEPDKPDNVLQKVDMDLLRVYNINLSIGYQFRLGRKTRLGFEIGYSVPLQTEFYTIDDPSIVLTKESEATMSTWSPGGLIFGISFSFDLI